MTILIADDNAEFCTTLGSIITDQGWNWYATHTPTETLDYLREHHAEVSVMLLDVEFRHPTLSGLYVLEQSRRLYPRLPVVMISGESTYQDVVKATRLGAVNFIPKTDVSREKVREVLYTEMDKLNRKTSDAELLAFMQRQGLVGQSKAMMKVAEQILKYGKTELSVLVTGETGTGKKIVAQALHVASRRNTSNFVTVDIPNIPQSLFQSELFGHIKGSFTGATTDKIGLFQQAHRGTLFLDEIGDLPNDLQPSLLLPIEDKKVRRLGSSGEEDANVRIIAATDRNLPEALAKGTFRNQLYHRLRECEITLPPLRERREDIPIIAEYYVQRHNAQMSEQKVISTTAVEYLQELKWEGNIRQLTSVLKCALQTSQQDTLGIDEILESDSSLLHQSFGNVFAVQYSAEQNLTSTVGVISRDISEESSQKNDSDSLAQMDTATMRDAAAAWRKETIIKSLARTKGNVSRSASELGVSRQCLHTWIGQYEIEYQHFRQGR